MAATPEDTLIIETSRGPVTVELRPDLAPNHVARIKELARQGFYDGVVFHRVIDGFMAQTGDPTGTGRGGSGQKLRAEFSKEPHTRGAVSMARAQSPDSADSQFFICFDDASFLDGQYTVWGRVSKGMENVDKITRGEPPSKPDKIVDHAGGRRRGLGPRQILVRVDDFDYHLPEELIALRPASPRDAARLLVVEPGTASLFADRKIADLPELLSAGDALVFNDTKVIPAELKGTRERDGTSAHISVTLTGRLDASRWTALARPAKRLKAGDRIVFGEGEGVCLLGTLAATVEERGAEGDVTLAFDFSDASLDEAIARLGAMPLPPYIASRRPAGREGPRRLSDDFRARGGGGGGADRRPAFHTPVDRGAGSARRVGAFRDAACRARHVSPGAQRRHRRPHHA